MDSTTTKHLIPPTPVFLRYKQDETWSDEMRFIDTFTIGRGDDCEVQIHGGFVSRIHVRISYDGELWWVKDLESSNGTFMDGVRITKVPLTGDAEFELGKGGPLFKVRLERAEPVKESTKKTSTNKKNYSSATQIVQNYYDKSGSEKAGHQTMMFRRALDRIHKKKSKKYLYIIGSVICLLLVAGGVIVYQTNKLSRLRNTAVNMFYSMKSLELQIAQVEEIVLLSANKDQVRELLVKRKHLKEMGNDYENFVRELGLYKKMGEESKLIYRMARLFGECEVNMPDSFVDEVMKYIKKWKSTTRLKNSIVRANSNDYAQKVSKVMTDNNLPSHFFYLALQESGYRSDSVGPKTRYGYAKGIWQFIPATAKHYGLKLGPLYKKKAYDAKDERFNFEKATGAAARYLRDINNTEAQASGLLVMASYNWGETKVRKIIRKMQENPKDRNFWNLLSNAKIPRETYDYVFYIFSAAVICENPQLFGFDFECPAAIM